MKKIPTLFVRNFDEHHNKTITREVTPGMEWVLAGEGVATIKIDGSCCAMIDGKFYRRYDVKKGKQPSVNAIPCCDPDPVTGHWPHWLPVEENDPGAKWFLEAYRNAEDSTDGTYEAIGPHFQCNPYQLEQDKLVRHGIYEVDVMRNFDGIREYLENHDIEGLVFWKDNEPKCKIKRTDFGFIWPLHDVSKR